MSDRVSARSRIHGVAQWTAVGCVTFVLGYLSVAVTAQQPTVSLSASLGATMATDWLVDPNPLLVVAGQPGSSIITIDPRYRDSSSIERQYAGRLRLSASCCYIPDVPGSVSPGVDVSVSALPTRSLGVGTVTPPWLRERLGDGGPTLSSAFVDVAGRPVQVRLTAGASPGAAQVPGNFLAWVGVEGTAPDISTSLPIMVNVLPPWPADGPAPACAPNVEALRLSSVNLYAVKAGKLSQTVFDFGAVEPVANVGLQITIRDEGITPRLAPTQAIVRFTNTAGWPVGIRSSNSRDCATPGRQWVAEAGAVPTTFTINAGDTTTLILSRSVCRAFFLFCWGTLGMDDVVTFTEGAFWTSFGGRAVDIQTVGDWGTAVSPFWGQADLVIRNP